jgi:hypothetical protein
MNKIAVLAEQQFFQKKKQFFFQPHVFFLSKTKLF